MVSKQVRTPQALNTRLCIDAVYRRAKLKRLTTDDRERMMRSRALPADFDMTQALHSPFGASKPSVTTPTPTPNTFPPFGQNSGLRPLTLDTLRRVLEYQPFNENYNNPTGVTPNLGAFAFTPPQSATDTMSPGSVLSNMSPFSYQTQGSPRRQPYGTAFGNQTGFAAHAPQMPRIQIHDRITRPVGETAGSPLRTSMSYSGLGFSSASQGQAEGTETYHERAAHKFERPRQSRSATNPDIASSGPYGLGFTCKFCRCGPDGFPSLLTLCADANVPSYQPSEHIRQPSSAVSSQPAVSFHQYRRNSSHLAGPPISYPQYPSAHFSTSHVSHYNPGLASQTFHAAYSQQMPNTQRQQDETQQQVLPQSQQSYTPISSQQHQFVPMAGSVTDPETNLGDNSDGGVSLQPGY